MLVLIRNNNYNDNFISVQTLTFCLLKACAAVLSSATLKSDVFWLAGFYGSSAGKNDLVPLCRYRYKNCCGFLAMIHNYFTRISLRPGENCPLSISIHLNDSCSASTGPLKYETCLPSLLLKNKSYREDPWGPSWLCGKVSSGCKMSCGDF